MKKTIFILIGTFLILAAPISLVTGIAYTLSMPKRYSAEATIHIHFPEPMGSGYDASALTLLTQSQVQLMHSEALLGRVIQNLDLQAKWGTRINEDESPVAPALAMLILKKSLSIAIVPNTSGLITVKAIQGDPPEAARTANELAAVYCDYLAKTPQQGGIYQATLITPAEPSIRPASPRVFQNMLVTLAMAALMLIAGITLIVGATRKINAISVQPAGAEFPPQGVGSPDRDVSEKRRIRMHPRLSWVYPQPERKGQCRRK